jgi:hypothetical protein
MELDAWVEFLLHAWSLCNPNWNHMRIRFRPVVHHERWKIRNSVIRKESQKKQKSWGKKSQIQKSEEIYNRSNINKLIDHVLPPSNKIATSSSLCSILYELCRFQDSRFNNLLSSIHTDNSRHSHDSECRRIAALEVFEWIKVCNAWLPTYYARRVLRVNADGQ